jgi:4-amino-4-deoxy-L-arabinose transferase-like glycosyltransferase
MNSPSATSGDRKVSAIRQKTSSTLVWMLLLAVFLAVHFSSLFNPALLDDADATHAQAAQHIAESGDWVTLKVNGIRYLEKPVLPYWIVALNYRIFGENAFATHLPLALSVLGCTILAWLWARQAWGDKAGLYAALGMLTSTGVFFFTRFFIPEALLTFLLSLALYCFLTGLEGNSTLRIYVTWTALALAVLTKGLIAPVFFFGAMIPYTLLSGQWRRWKQMRIFSGLLLFLAIAAPWHILAGLRNPNQGHPIGNIPSPGNVHGFYYFYFINEHVLRFLGQRYPHDYAKLPGILYWTLHLAWLFPWSIFLPVVTARAWTTRRTWMEYLRPNKGMTVDFYIDNALRTDVATYVGQLKFRTRTTWLLSLYAGFILIFFAISTNQEYYTWPAYFPLVVLMAGAVANLEDSENEREKIWLNVSQGLFCFLGLAASGALAWGLWESRNLPAVSDLGTLLVHRQVADYSLSMAHFFDLTGPSFAALRAPAATAAIALFFGPILSWIFRLRKKHAAATVTVAITAVVFLIAAHIAFERFAPMLSSKPMADIINEYGTPSDTLMLYGDQAEGSSVIFYTHHKLNRPALLVHGRTTSMLWGSYYPDAPKIFVEDSDLTKGWGNGERKWLFVPGSEHDHVNQLLAGRLYTASTLADKTLYTDRPVALR